MVRRRAPNLDISHNTVWGSYLIGLILFLAAWQGLAWWLGPLRLPNFIDVFKAFFAILSANGLREVSGSTGSGIMRHLVYSVQQTLTGCGIGVSVGIVLGLAMSTNSTVERIFTVPVDAARTIPPLVIIPFFIIWFGTGASTQVGIIAFYASVRTVIYTFEAVRNIPSVYFAYARTAGARSAQIMRTVMLPGVVPELVGGIRTILATSWGIEVVAELLGARIGIGRVFSVLIMVLAVDRLIAAILWVVIVANVADYVFVRLARYLTRWSPSVQR